MKKVKIIGAVLTVVLLLTSAISVTAMAKNVSQNEEENPVSQNENKETNNYDIPITIDINEENKAELSKLLQEYKIDKSYSYGTFEIDGETVHYWEKPDKDGIGNPYDALKIRLDENGNVISTTRFDEASNPQNTTLSKEDAENTALEFFRTNRIANNCGYVKENSAVTSAETEYVKPNGIWNWCHEGEDHENAEPRLVHNVCIDGKYFIYVDTETGDVIGGDMLK